MKLLTAEMIEAFAGVYLSPRYDSPQPTPEFHRECWARYCSDEPAAATAAPRNHAKSTGLTHDFGLACAVFREESYIIIVGASEDMAIEHLGDIATELRENELLIQDFKISHFVVDQKTDIIVECTDGYQFRFIARGAEQKIRGRKWRGKRPGLIIGDDLEDDEQVESKDRRRKFRRWFFRACKQALRDGGKIRVHGTILHEDSLLARLMKNSEWATQRYQAHASFDDFSNVLWPEKFPEERLRAIRQEFINEGDAPGYSQEYLNDPLDNEDVYLRKEDFLPMESGDYGSKKIYGCGVDFAVSKQDAANRTSFTIGGVDAQNILSVVDQRVGRMQSDAIVEEFFSIHERWDISEQDDFTFWVEDGQIWLSIAPFLNKEMVKRGTFLNIVPVRSSKDKAVRGRSLQKRMRAGGCRFDMEASWYPGYEVELLKFTGVTEATLDDQFDSTALLSLGFEGVHVLDDEDFMSDEEKEFEAMVIASRKADGRSAVTGY